MLESRIKVVLIWTITSFITCGNSQMLNKTDCGKTKSCYSIPASCSSSQDCEYLLKYSVSGQDVTFELSSSKYQWIAVGFNPTAGQMAGGESLACETSGSKVLLRHYNMPKKARPSPSSDANATLLSGSTTGNILICKIQRKLDLGAINRTNLHNKTYFLYAAGPMEDNGDIGFHSEKETSQTFLDVSTISDNTDNSTAKKMLNKDDCGKTKSCYSIPASCSSSQDCEYLLKYSVSGQDVTFELSSSKYKWIAVGFNPTAGQMAGGESLACETSGSKVLLRHYNMPKKARPSPSSDANATLLSGNMTGNILICKIQRKLDLGAIGRTNLRNKAYFLYAAGPMKSNGDIGFHSEKETSLTFLDVSTISDNTDNSKATKRIDTSHCGKTLGCAKSPSGCLDNRDCEFLLTFSKNGTEVEFSVSGKAGGWVAVGFNDKPKMGGTDAVICQPSTNGSIKMSVANLGYSSPDLKPRTEVKFLEGEYKGEVIYCKFTRPLKTYKRLSLDNSRYLVYGKGPGKTKLNKHADGDRGCSVKKVDFAKTVVYVLNDCEADRLEKAHGSIMLFAWAFLVVISIFIARYSRSLWKGWKIYGEDAWFQFHRLIMGLAIVLTIIAIIIIFVDKKGWSESVGNHGIFGIIVLVLAIIQPTIAFFRPHPNEPRRREYNWFHRIVAFILVIFVVVTVFMGTEHLKDSGGDTSCKVMIALIVIAIITALILEYLALRLRVKKFEASDDADQLQEEKQGGAGVFLERKIQRILLLMFSLLVFILTVVMIAYVAGAGSDDDDDDDDDD